MEESKQDLTQTPPKDSLGEAILLSKPKENSSIENLPKVEDGNKISAAEKTPEIKKDRKRDVFFLTKPSESEHLKSDPSKKEAIVKEIEQDIQWLEKLSTELIDYNGSEENKLRAGGLFKSLIESSEYRFDFQRLAEKELTEMRSTVQRLKNGETISEEEWGKIGQILNRAKQKKVIIKNFFMDNKTKIFLSGAGVVILILIGLVVFLTLSPKDPIISQKIDCDPYTEKCFIRQCDPASSVAEEKCTGDLATDVSYYKIASRRASKVKFCDSASNELCFPFECDENEKDCSEVFCTEGNKDGAKCNNPVEYAKDHPLVEAVSECDPNDAECLKAEAEATNSEATEEPLSDCDINDTECLEANGEEAVECAPNDPDPACVEVAE